MVTLEDINDFIGDNPDIILSHPKELTPRVKSFPMANNCLTLIVGATGSGKSYQIGQITQRIPYDIVFFISPTNSFDQTSDESPIKSTYSVKYYGDPEDGVNAVYDYLLRRLVCTKIVNDIKELSEKYKTTIDFSQEGYEEKLMKLLELFEKICGIYDPEELQLDNTVLVIMDDCGYNSTQMHNKQTPIMKLAMIRRHLGVNIILSLQSYVQVGKDIRRNASDVILNKKVTPDDIKAIQKDLANMPHKSIITSINFLPLYNFLTEFDEYPYVQLLFGGFYKDFKEIGRNKIESIIQKAKAVEEQQKLFIIGNIDQATLHSRIKRIRGIK